MQPLDDFLEDLEADLLPLKYIPGQWQTITAGSPRAITSGSRPPFKSAVMNWSTEPGVSPSQPPNQSPVQPMIETTHLRVRPVQPRGKLDARRDAPSIGEEMPEIVGNLGTEDVTASVQRAARKLRQGTSCRSRRAW